MNRLKWAQDHEAMKCNQVIFSDETTIRPNCDKGLLRNLPEKKRNRYVELMWDISKCGLLSTARKQFGHVSMLWKLQEDNEPKHTWKLAVN